MTRELRVLGKATPKRDGGDKVTGRTCYLHDLELPRLAHGKILRARYPHARIIRIDAARAAALPGVLAVLTGADVEPRPFGFAKDQVALKRGKVRCIRDEVAAIAAESAEIAEAALALIDVEYAELPSSTRSSALTSTISATRSRTATWTAPSPRRPRWSRTPTGWAS